MNLPKEVIAYISATQILIDEADRYIEEDGAITSEDMEKAIKRCGILYHKMLQRHTDDSKK